MPPKLINQAEVGKVAPVLDNKVNQSSDRTTKDFPTLKTDVSLTFVDETQPVGDGGSSGDSSRKSSSSDEQFIVSKRGQAMEKDHKSGSISKSVEPKETQQPNGVATLVETRNSANAKVSIVSFKRLKSIDKSYAALDICNDGEGSGDEDTDELDYGHISTTWVTSFWTQFSVLLQRNFKQSKPEILSKINLLQVNTFRLFVNHPC